MAQSFDLRGFSEIEPIGFGGFSSIYRAREDSTGRLVALKVVDARGVPEVARDAFRREAAALGSLSTHPNIVTLYQAIDEDEQLILVLELCQESAADVLRRSGPLPLPLVLSYGAKLAGALETAHRADMLHRDIKPQNVLITAYGEPALADFGIARLQASASQMTATNMQAFTAAHAAPEILEGQRLTPATDVYELASTLYTLLSGKAPFAPDVEESPVATIVRIMRDPVPPLPRTHAPPELSAVLERAMAKVPSERPTSALDFLRSLNDVEALLGLDATRPALATDAMTGVAAGQDSAKEVLEREAKADTYEDMAAHSPHTAAEAERDEVPEAPTRLRDAPESRSAKAPQAEAYTVPRQSQGGTDASPAGPSENQEIPHESPRPRSRRRPRTVVLALVIAVVLGTIGVTIPVLLSPGAARISLVRVLSTGYHFRQPGAIATDGSHVWVANLDGNSVTEVDAATGKLVRVLNTGFHFDTPAGILADGSHVWVGNWGNNTVTELTEG